MKKYLYILIGYIVTIETNLANADVGFFEGSGVSAEDMRNGNIHLETIPKMIKAAIDFFIQIAGTVAIIFVIVGAYKILFGSLEQDKTKGKDTIIMALGGFALASLAWFIIKAIIENLV